MWVPVEQHGSAVALVCAVPVIFYSAPDITHSSKETHEVVWTAMKAASAYHHDLRSPLHGKTSQRQNLPDESKRFWNMHLVSGNNPFEQVDKLILVWKLEAGTRLFQRQKHAIFIPSVSVEYPVKKIYRITVVVLEQVSRPRGQIFQNILSNARKFI